MLLRAGPARKFVWNFTAETAAERGIDVVTLEGTTLAHQVQLFYRYQSVAMMHGAALANFVWLRPGATLIDIRPSELEPWPDHPWPHGYMHVYLYKFQIILGICDLHVEGDI